MTHLVAALRAAGDRDVVAMTVRLVGIDVPDDPTVDPRATDDERTLLAAIVALAEREGRAVRLMIVPGVNVFDSVIETALRLDSSEIHVGESETLSADEQARLLGDAWERAPKPKPGSLRLVVHHPRGTTAAYQLGAHAPALRRRTSNRFTGSGSTSPGRRAPRASPRCGARRAQTYGKQLSALTATPRSSWCATRRARPTNSRPC